MGKKNTKKNSKNNNTNRTTVGIYGSMSAALRMSHGKTTSMKQAKEILQKNHKLALDAYNNDKMNLSDSSVETMLKDESSFTGIEGIPYQFMPSVDPRPGNSGVGRKYAEKIFGRMPIVIITPCKQVFMDNFSDTDKVSVLDMLGSSESDKNVDELIQGKGKYYNVIPDYSEYYDYLNPMLTSMAAFLNLANKKVRIAGQEAKPLSDIDWSCDTSEQFSRWLSAKGNLTFYADSMTSVSETFGNDSMESSLASAINGYSDTAKEISFLLGNGEAGGIAAALMKDAEKATSSVTSSLSDLINRFGGGLVASVANKGINTLVNGGKIQFPKIWGDSSHGTSYSINFKFRSPDNDSLSIFLNVLKPYAKLLALVLPKADGENVNGYKSPHLVRCTCPGFFCIDMGLITGLSVNKGDESAWNDDGLPTQIDVTLDIEDLYTSTLFMSGYTGSFISGLWKRPTGFVNNTAYMDFLMSTCGVNIHLMPIGRMLAAWGYIAKNNIITTPSRVMTYFDQRITNWLGSIYNKFT